MDAPFDKYPGLSEVEKYVTENPATHVCEKRVYSPGQYIDEEPFEFSKEPCWFIYETRFNDNRIFYNYAMWVRYSGYPEVEMFFTLEPLPETRSSG